MARAPMRMLQFPVQPISGVGDSLLRTVRAVPQPPTQYELFPEPPETSPYSLDNLVMQLTGVLVRITRLGGDLLPRHALTLWAIVSLANTLLPDIELEIAQRRERQQQEYVTRIA